MQVTRLIPDARGTKCDQEIEPVLNTKHSHILRVPFRTENGILRQWVSRFDIYPYLERYAQACALYRLYNPYATVCFLYKDSMLFQSYISLKTRMLLLRSLPTWNANQTS